MRTDIALLALLAAGAPMRSSAQASEHRLPVVFLEKAYFSLASPTGKNLTFEGMPTVHYFIRNRLSDDTWQREGGWQWVLPVSALFQVRMFNTTSAPVRTPSFRIRPLNAQFVHLKRPADDRLAFRLIGISVAFAHYSNGQSGCTYLGFDRDGDSERCDVADDTLAAKRLANTIDGDFSTSYFSAGVNWRRGKLLGSDEPVSWQWELGAEAQIHPYDIKPGGINREQAAEWGQHQWTVTGMFERRIMPSTFLRSVAGDIGVLRVAGLHEQRLGGGVDSPLTRTQVELSFVSGRVEDLGVFVRWHTGFDYYNINFQDTRRFVAIGVMWDLARLDKLRTAPPQ